MADRVRRRGPCWESLGHGVAIPSGLAGEVRFRAELTAWSAALPTHHAFTGLTGARAHGLWLPPLPADLPHFVAVWDEDVRCRRSQLRVTRHTAEPAVVMVHDVPVTTVPECILACAADLGLLDLLVLIDGALHLEKCSLDDLIRVGDQRRRGAPSLRRALAWCDGRAESAWEVLLRVLHTSCGIEVEPQVDIHDDDGRFLGRADLLVVGTVTMQEYDGWQHAERRQYRKDRRRDGRIGRTQYTRHGWLAEDVLYDGWLILKEACHALGRDLTVDLARPWFALLEESLFSTPGTARLRGRWRMGPEPGKPVAVATTNGT